MNLRSFLIAAALAASAGAAEAGALADIGIIDRTTGERLPTWRHGGRLYVAGRPGNRYAVELSNRSGGRLLAILSVDGVNAVSGETAAGNQSGYVLDPRQSAQILGWRKSMDDVAAFYFTALPDSYAARTGRPDNVGVIGVAVYREYQPPVLRRSPPRPFDFESAPAAPAGRPQASAAASEKQEADRAAPAERLGTGHGELVASSTQYTSFHRASEWPAEVITIYYDSYDNLLAQGVIPAPCRPRAFPGGFVPDPA